MSAPEISLPRQSFVRWLLIQTVWLCICLFPGKRDFSQGRIWFSELGAQLAQQQKVAYSGGQLTSELPTGVTVNINNGGRWLAVCLEYDYMPVPLKNVPVQPAVNNSLKFWEIFLGLRYYPMLPSIRVGTALAVRFTAGALFGGYEYYWKETEAYAGVSRKWSPLYPNAYGFAGLCFSSFRNSTGLSLRLNYRPMDYVMHNYTLTNFSMKEPYSLSACLLIGSRVRK